MAKHIFYRVGQPGLTSKSYNFEHFDDAKKFAIEKVDKEGLNAIDIVKIGLKKVPRDDWRSEFIQFEDEWLEAWAVIHPDFQDAPKSKKPRVVKVKLSDIR